jgi:hypothetical protein
MRTIGGTPRRPASLAEKSQKNAGKGYRRACKSYKAVRLTSSRFAEQAPE